MLSHGLWDEGKGQEQKASLLERQSLSEEEGKRAGARPGPFGKVRVQIPARPGMRRLAPRARRGGGSHAETRVPLGRGPARCGGRGPSSECGSGRLRGAWPRKAVNSCRVLLAGSARSLVPCSELIIR